MEDGAAMCGHDAEGRSTYGSFWSGRCTPLPAIAGDELKRVASRHRQMEPAFKSKEWSNRSVVLRSVSRYCRPNIFRPFEFCDPRAQLPALCQKACFTIFWPAEESRVCPSACSPPEKRIAKKSTGRRAAMRF